MKRAKSLESAKGRGNAAQIKCEGRQRVDKEEPERGNLERRVPSRRSINRKCVRKANFNAVKIRNGITEIKF